MITVVVDRDSVAAGDDANPHAADWEFADDARLGDVVLRIVDTHFLPSMRDVTWTLSLVGESGLVNRDAEGRVYYVSPGNALRPIGVLLTDGEVNYRYAALGGSGTARTRLSELRTTCGTGELVVFTTYGSGGRLIGIDDLRDVVAETDAQEEARWAAYRARTWPQYFDEHGNRRASP